MDGDILICPHCKADIERYELDKAFDSQEEIIVCPSCGEKIREEDLE